MEARGLRWARGAGAAALLLGALATLGAQWWQQRAISPEADWAAAAAHVRAKWSPGDAFRVVPQWDSRARVYLQDKSYVPAEAPTWFDVAEHPRVWALWEAGREGEVLGSTPAGWAPEGEVAGFGVIRAQAFARRGEDPTLWDALGALPQAQVWRVSPAREQQCADYDAGQRAWHCRPRDPWLYVGESVQTVTNDAHRCVWAMPVERGSRLEVRFAGVPGGALRGYYGQSLEAVRSERGAPVRFGVEVGGRGVWSAELGVHEEGFRAFAVALPEGSQEVRFVVESEDKTDRFFCFAARVVKAGAAD